MLMMRLRQQMTTEHAWELTDTNIYTKDQSKDAYYYYQHLVLYLEFQMWNNTTMYL